MKPPSFRICPGVASASPFATMCVSRRCIVRLPKAVRRFITVPSAFTVRTGEAHWHTLLRARAIENGCYIFAAAQAGKHESGRETLWPLADRRSVGRRACRRRQYRARHRHGENRSRQGRERAQDHSIAAAWPPLRRCRSEGLARSICIWSGDRHDPVQFALRPRPRVRELVPEFVRLRSRRKSASW